MPRKIDERALASKIIQSLAIAFGGHSQVRVEWYGEAVAGHLVNSDLTDAQARAMIQVIADWLLDYWEDGRNDTPIMLAAYEKRLRYNDDVW